MILYLPIAKATQLSFFDRMQLPTQTKLVHEKSGKTHLQKYHVGNKEEEKIVSLSPRDDYAKNGTRSKAFKAWFGDWERDPEHSSKVVNDKGEPQETYHLSKVRDDKGKPITVYHGTATGGFSEFDFKKTNPLSLYGSGFYFTEDQEIADEYSGKGAEHEFLKPKESLIRIVTRMANKKFRDGDLSSEKTGEIIGLVHAVHISENLKALKKKTSEWGLDIDSYVKQKGGFETKSVFLNIRNPIDINKKMKSSEVENIINSMSEYDWGKNIKVDKCVEKTIKTIKDDMENGIDITFNAIYSELQYQTSSLAIPSHSLQITEWIRSMGYDGITHIGGRVMGNKEHRVWIAFEPNQIKAVSNDGTFDPTTNNMYKAVNHDVIRLPTKKRLVHEKSGKTHVQGFHVKNDDWNTPMQEHTSADTSINATQLPASFKKISWKPGTINADIGGGRFDNATEYLKSMGVENIIYDPYNRSKEHNARAIEKIKNGGANTATINNVLNVIKEPEARQAVIRQAHNAINDNGTAYFLIYEGNGSGNGKPTTKGWQENRTAASYIHEIESVFDKVTKKGNMIIAYK